MTARLHAVEFASRANGPGLRAVVWFQGCTLACPGCFNPRTHDPGGGYEMDIRSLAEALAASRAIEGVSVSGGEPFQQPEALADLVRRLRATPLGILIFSGYTLERIRTIPRGPAILDCIDVLVAGPYIQALHSGQGLVGSANQRIHLLTGRYTLAGFASLPRREVILHRDGTLTLSGIAPLSIPGSRRDFSEQQRH